MRIISLLVLCSCVRPFERLQPPSTLEQPPLVRIVPVADRSAALMQQVSIATHVCESGACAYQLKGGATYADWTDCGVTFAARFNDAGGRDAQDSACQASTNFVFALNANADNRLSIRTRNAEGRVSIEDTAAVEQDSLTPPAPANISVLAKGDSIASIMERRRPRAHCLMPRSPPSSKATKRLRAARPCSSSTA